MFLFGLILLVRYALGSDFVLTDAGSFVLVGTLLFILINTKRFLFLGEAERYLTHLFVPILLIVFAPSLTYDISNFIYLILFYGLIYFLLEFILLRWVSKKGIRQKADSEILGLLQSFDDDKLIACYSYHNFGAYRVLYETNHRTILPLHMVESERVKFVKKFEKEYSILDLTKLQEICDRTGLYGLILDVNAYQRINAKSFEIDVGWEEFELKNKVYRLFVRRNDKNEAFQT